MGRVVNIREVVGSLEEHQDRQVQSRPLETSRLADLGSHEVRGMVVSRDSAKQLSICSRLVLDMNLASYNSRTTTQYLNNYG